MLSPSRSSLSGGGRTRHWPELGVLSGGGLCWCVMRRGLGCAPANAQGSCREGGGAGPWARPAVFPSQAALGLLHSICLVLEQQKLARRGIGLEKTSDLRQPPKPLRHSCPSTVPHFPRVRRGLLALPVSPASPSAIPVFSIHVSCGGDEPCPKSFS